LKISPFQGTKSLFPGVDEDELPSTPGFFR
jgi:hypothetical protein